MERNSRISYFIIVLILVAMSLICLANMKLERENNRLRKEIEVIKNIDNRKDV